MFGLFRGAQPQLDTIEISRQIADGTLVLVDVRDPSEIAATGKAKGAINLPLVTLTMKTDPSSPECLAEFKDGRAIAVYCASGGRSAGAAQMLTRMGHKDVRNIGGIRDWAMNGGELE